MSEESAPRQLPRRSIALVLAGGRGSRLKQLTDRRAKPAVPFGGKFRIIDFALSNCINSGGEKIFPEEVEEALKAHPAVFDCLVVDTPDERFGSKVTAVVAVRGGEELTLDSLQAEARKHIAGYKVPRELHIVDEIPRAPSGNPAYPQAREIALEGSYRVL